MLASVLHHRPERFRSKLVDLVSSFKLILILSINIAQECVYACNVTPTAASTLIHNPCWYMYRGPPANMAAERTNVHLHSAASGRTKSTFASMEYTSQSSGQITNALDSPCQRQQGSKQKATRSLAYKLTQKADRCRDNAKHQPNPSTPSTQSRCMHATARAFNGTLLSHIL